MNSKVIIGGVLSYAYNHILSNLPSRNIRHAYLKAYLGSMERGTGIQMGCKFLHGRKVFLGDRNVINFGCLFDGRHYPIKTGSDVSILSKLSEKTKLWQNF